MSALVVLGNVNVDLILGVLRAWPEPGTETVLSQAAWRVGGNAGNAAVALGALSADASIISTVGNDLPGHWLREQLQGLPVTWITVPEPTSITVAFSHPDGERSFVTHLGHLKSLCWEQLHPHLPTARMALLAGAFLTPTLRQNYPELLQNLAARGVQTALDAGWPDDGFTPAIRAEVASWLPYVHLLLVNEAEASGLTCETHPEDAARQLAQHMSPGGTVVVKQGRQGALALQNGTLVQVRAPEVQVVDTVGAGDTFNAAYLHALLQGYDQNLSLTFGVQVASHAVSSEQRHVLPAALLSPS
ncbi:carbohydrate kinase family protein [Deinococcus oregonensis]|uniref:Carbohydrate kinase family protein n=1 Tax=Deinococcus oregonensis TaxID=1805970 RepID=A0ABV6AVB6_9DEIO